VVNPSLIPNSMWRCISAASIDALLFLEKAENTRETSFASWGVYYNGGHYRDRQRASGAHRARTRFGMTVAGIRRHLVASDHMTRGIHVDNRTCAIADDHIVATASECGGRCRKHSGKHGRRHAY